MTADAALMASTTSQCASVDVCYLGGSTSTTCTVSDGSCAPCVTFADNGCYVKVNGACPFGVDCTSVWYGSSSGSTSSGSSSKSGSTAAGSASATGGTTGKSGDSSGSMSSSAAGSVEGGTKSDSSSSGGSDMSVVFAIIGAAIGVIAVAVIFLTLVRRSRAAREDDDDMQTPPAFAKNTMQAPGSTTGAAATYGAYGRGAAGSGASATGIPTLGSNPNLATLEAGPAPSSGVMSYYAQQPPQTSAAPSPRVAGRAFPSAAPMGVGRASQPGAAYANAPQPGAGYSNVQQVATTTTSYAVEASYAPEPVKAPQAQPPPTPLQMQGAPGAATSPRTRRESYEF